MTTTTTTTLVYPIWRGQHGPAMPLSEVDQKPVIILQEDASAEQIAEAQEALRAIMALA